MNRRQKIIVSVTGIFIVLLILIGLTYAYFLTRITGNSNPTSISVTTANLELVYGDGTTSILTSSTPIEPGKFSSSKDFTVTNNGNALTDYAVTLEDFSITYANDTVINGEQVKAGTVTKMEYPDDMKMTISCVIESEDEDRNGQACGNINGTLPTENSILLTNSIEVDDIHKYVLTLTYVDSGIDQSADMNKTIKGKIDIIDPKSTIDLEGTVASYQTGDYVEINSTPTKSEIVDGKYKLIGVEPGEHTLYVKYKDANGDIQTRGSQTLIIKKGDEASVSGNTIIFTDASRTVTVDVDESYEINLDETIKSSLRDAIIANSMSNKNGTKFVTEPLSGIVTTGSGKNYDTTITEGTATISSIPSVYTEYYLTYTDDYIVDKKNGFTLKGVNTCKYSECYGSLTNKYLVSKNDWSIFSSVDSPVSTTGLNTIYKVTTPGTSATGSVSLASYSLSTIDIEEKTLTTTQDDYGTSYYYRGNVDDNYVNFNNMCWRIVRIEGDGSVKLILEDKNTTCNDTEDTDGEGVEDYKFTGNWNAANDFAYGEVFFGCSGDPKDIVCDHPGNLPVFFEKFQTSELSGVLDKLKTEEWCYDDTVTKREGDVTEYYGAYTRIETNKKPSLSCSGTKLTKYSDNIDMYVGTLTAEEILFAGVRWGNNANYLINSYAKNNSLIWWSLSPYFFDEYEGFGYAYTLDSSYGNLSSDGVSSGGYTARPSITLINNTEITSGTGTQSDPYVIE